VKAERDGNKVLVPLPRGANRDQAVAVEIVYAQKMGTLKTLLPRDLVLVAPQTDIQTTYAEWEVFVPETHRLANFGGNMTVAQGTTYRLHDAWVGFERFYDYLYQSTRGMLLGFIIMGGILWFVVTAVRRGWRGALAVLTVIAIAFVMAAMLLPALNQSREKARRANELSNLKQVGLGMAMFAEAHQGQLPNSLDDMLGSVITSDRVFIDPSSGQRLAYLGAGRRWQSEGADLVLAHSPTDHNGNGRNVLFTDGHVAFMSEAGFNEVVQRTMAQVANQPQALPRGAVQPAGLAGEGAADTLMVNALAASASSAGTPPPPPAVTATLSGGVGSVNGAPKPAVAGIRPIRIEIPKTGLRFVFTKVLNVRDEPLSARALVMTGGVRNTIRSALELGALLIGLGLLWWQWRSAFPKSLVLTIGLALVLASITHMLIAWRLLHVALILAPPALVLAIIVRLVRRYWAAQGGANAAENSLAGTSPAPSGVPPVVALIALMFFAVGARADDVSILSATYSGAVHERIAQMDAVIQVNAAEPNQRVKLFGGDAAVQQFTATPSEVKLVRDGSTVAALLPRRGTATLRVKFLVKLGGDVAKRQLAFGIPSALSSQFVVTIDETEAAVEVPTAVSFKTAVGKQQTRVEAVMGAGDRLELRWTPRVKRAEEIAATVLCQNATLVSFAHGVMSTRVVLDYQVTQGELRQMRVRVPADQRVLRVQGELIRTWEMKGDPGEQVLHVELLKGVSPNYRLTVEAEKVIDALPATVRVETAHALDVKRETGLVALAGSEELGLTVETSQETQRVDVEEFMRTSRFDGAGITTAYRFLKPEFDLRVRVETLQPQIEAVVRNHLLIGTDQLNLTAHINYTIKRAGVFTLRVALPPDYRLETVTGQNVSQWVEKGSGAERVLEVALKERTMGAYELQLGLAKLLKELPQKVEVAGVQPLDVQKLSGFATVSSEVGMQVKTDTFEGLTEVPAATVAEIAPRPGENAAGLLAFKFMPTETVSAQRAWKLGVTTEAVDPWLRAEIVSWMTVGETLVSGRTVVRYDIQNAPVKELRLRVPSAFKNVEVLGENIRRRDQNGETWQVELQNKVRGTYTLTITWERPWDPKHGDFDFAGVEAVAVERETGALAVIAHPPLQVNEKTTSGDLIRIDARELPDWAGRADEATVLAYRYLRPGYKLALTGRRFDEAEVLQALVDNVRLTTVVAEDGQMMTEVAFAVRNNGRQYLEITLPQGAEVWSAFVAGGAVRPSVREGRLLLPLERAGADEAAIPVQVTYVSSQKFPARSGRITLESPAVDVPLKNAQWELYLPTDYDYRGFAGTMMHEIGGAPVQQVFTLSDYTRDEQVRKTEAVVQSLSFLSVARKKLAGGNVKEALSYYNSAVQNRNETPQSGQQEYQQLELDLRRAQASNVAQGGNILMNDGHANWKSSLPEQASGLGGVQAQSTSQLGPQFDEETAAKQWDKLQQAQELAVAKVLPLRVNLPTHGVRHVFTQVLQTEVKVPMKVSFEATNTGSTSWPVRVSLSVVGFAALWLLVAGALAWRRS
jgi:prepilin-type processing-associated H-X9-DG protein